MVRSCTPARENRIGMAARIAVVTDAVSDQFFFPAWHRYYGGLFGETALFVVTYAGAAGFAGLPLGGLLRLPVGYDDTTRANVITDLVATLLGAYDVVIRVDTDEFLVVDPSAAPSLRAYIETTEQPYYTARGFDVLQTLSEPALQPGPMLAQRQVAYPNTALNKTAIVRTPLHWSAGFHWCSAYPQCGPLFLLHLKRIDIEWQMRWFAEMTQNIDANPAVSLQIKDYYRPDRPRIEQYHRDVGARPRLSGIAAWYRDDLQRRFLASLAYHPQDDLYVGAYEHDNVLCEIPPPWRHLL